MYSDRMCLERLIPTGSIIGLESALSYYGLCDFADQYMVLLFEGKSPNIHSRYFKLINRNNHVDNSILNSTPSITPNSIIDYTPSNGRLKITTPECSICEMIVLDRRDDFIIQALQNYLIFKIDDSYSEEKLYSKAKEYGIYDKLMEYVEWAYEDLEDMC